ncbi:ankyrin repeat domain-containing protein 29 [Coprinopsis cinerea okayama7|uniref:Ankyrin repeat domain-containing protein 29 n=1 Tax=Coprinopsis cinerea (strain Okayama-7 / 130 / ATCC MYA-4618 / FGSC 9003) TaxID=240176 RepID=A8NAF9_COPC7|nr:ankyrin repeat domain-containing protein 29 [Coprinopsis cinerea okayama7\|eukprot:XP_001831811.2 ankyrin repeat domain-containing protein 29 [Coprinopsis cinerea okayama7\
MGQNLSFQTDEWETPTSTRAPSPNRDAEENVANAEGKVLEKVKGREVLTSDEGGVLDIDKLQSKPESPQVILQPVVSIADNARISGGIIAGGDVHTNVVINIPSAKDSSLEAQWQKKEEEKARARLLREVLDWLAPNAQFREIQMENLEKWTDGTLSWFTTAEFYQSWKQGRTKVIWGTGMPGSGKTVLASKAVDDLEQHQKTSKGKLCVLFAYCRYSERLTVQEILEALVKQFLECDPSLVSVVEPLYARHTFLKTRPTQAELLDLLKTLESHFEIVFYVIDALDEALDDTQFNLVKAINTLQGRFSLTSRPLVSLESGLARPKFYTVTPATSDIVRLVLERIKHNPGFGDLLDRYGFRDELVRRILDKSSGMFLHAALQLEFVYTCATVACVHRNLDRVPTGLRQMYQQAMVRIGEQKAENALLAKHTLLWLVFGYETMAFADLEQALAVTSRIDTAADNSLVVDEAALVSVCCGLVIIEKRTNLVRLVHFTAKDALAPILMNDFHSPHRLLFKAAAKRLIDCGIPNNSLLKQGTDLERFLAQHPALRYSYDHLGKHAQECVTHPEYCAEVLEFVKRCQSFPCIVWGSWKPVEHLSPIHVAARYGLHEIIDQVIADTAKGDVTLRTTGERGATALILAAQYGQVRVVDALLKHKRRAMMKSVIGGHAKPGMHLLTGQVNLRDNSGSTALMEAVSNCHPDVVRRLLQDPHIQVNLRDRSGWTALMYAAMKSHVVLDPLLAHEGADVNARNDDGCTALMEVSKYGAGAGALVQRLLTHKDIKVNLQGKDGNSALMYAALKGHSVNVRHLLQHKDTQANLQSRDGWTALMRAAKNGNDGAVRALIEYKGTDVNAVNNYGDSALIIASRELHPGVVSVLLQREDIRTDIRNIAGQTALMVVTQYPVRVDKQQRCDEVVRLLRQSEKSSDA